MSFLALLIKAESASAPNGNQLFVKPSIGWPQGSACIRPLTPANEGAVAEASEASKAIGMYQFN